ncbi:MAG: hypothetical protein U0793_18835 [Gemmataceae bacterium]
MFGFGQRAGPRIFGAALIFALLIGVGQAANGLAPRLGASGESTTRTGPQDSFVAARAAARLHRLSRDEQERLVGVVKMAGSAAERGYLTKAIAAGHAPVIIERFAARIRGKDAVWLRNHLRLTSSDKGLGIRQQWKHSCGPTTVMAFLGELDPLYAERVHAENPNFYLLDELNPTRYNPRLAAEQKRLLEKNTNHEKGGKAAPRGGKAGKGRWSLDLLNEHTARTGLRFSWKPIGAGFSVADALRTIEALVARGVPVPIVVAAEKNKHCVLITAVWHKDGHTGFNVHDPWTGRTLRRSAEQFITGRLNIASNQRFHGVYLPTLLPL